MEAFCFAVWFCIFISFALLAFKGMLCLEGYPAVRRSGGSREGQCVSGDLQCALEGPRLPAWAAGEGGAGNRAGSGLGGWEAGSTEEEGCAVGAGESGHPQRPL